MISVSQIYINNRDIQKIYIQKDVLKQKLFEYEAVGCKTFYKDGK